MVLIKMLYPIKKSLSPKQVKEKLKGPLEVKSFFEFAAKRVEQKFNEKFYTVVKSGVSILYNLSGFLSKDNSLTLKQSRTGKKKTQREN